MISPIPINGEPSFSPPSFSPASILFLWSFFGPIGLGIAWMMMGRKA